MDVNAAFWEIFNNSDSRESDFEELLGNTDSHDRGDGSELDDAPGENWGVMQRLYFPFSFQLNPEEKY